MVASQPCRKDRVEGTIKCSNPCHDGWERARSGSKYSKVVGFFYWGDWDSIHYKGGGGQTVLHSQGEGGWVEAQQFGFVDHMDHVGIPGGGDSQVEKGLETREGG